MFIGRMAGVVLFVTMCYTILYDFNGGVKRSLESWGFFILENILCNITSTIFKRQW